jgi:hypothetical protein
MRHDIDVLLQLAQKVAAGAARWYRGHISVDMLRLPS